MDDTSVHGPVHGPVDPDVTPEDVAFSVRMHGLLRRHWDVLAVIAAGGAVGSAGRYGLSVLWPASADGIPWATLATNVIGCLMLGWLMFFVSDVWPQRRYVRPFVGVGVLGGFTTFSTQALETRHLLVEGRGGLALGYVAATLVLALAAVVAGALFGRVVAGAWVRR